MNESDDTALRLREAYAGAGGFKSVFSPKAADYAASRPDYPTALVATLRGELTAGLDSRIADVGAGTGLLTQGLLDLGCAVTSVEPNADMRAEADRRLAGRPGYRSIAGSAEALPLPDRSLDLITAAQAFHWFEIERTRAEFLRVLKPRGQVALIWNDRVLDAPLHVALDDIFAQFGGAQRGALLAHENRADVPRFFRHGAKRELSWPHVQRLDQDGCVSFVFSRSYMPRRETDAGRESERLARSVHARFARNGFVDVPYRTVLILGRPA